MIENKEKTIVGNDRCTFIPDNIKAYVSRLKEYGVPGPYVAIVHPTIYSRLKEKGLLTEDSYFTECEDKECRVVTDNRLYPTDCYTMSQAHYDRREATDEDK